MVIDPYRTRTARCADWYLPINPGTDAALALGMMHVIIHQGLHDADYVERYTLGFNELRDKVQQYTPELVAKWTGISAEDIVKLARDMRRCDQRQSASITACSARKTAAWPHALSPCCLVSPVRGRRLAAAFKCLLSGAFGLNREAIKRTDLMEKSLGRPARIVNMVELGKALNELKDPPVQALFVYNSNPAAVCPNHNEVVRGLLRPDLFTVVHEQFFTDTTDFADIVLPATTFFEHKDLQTAYGHYFLQVSDQAIEPLGECRSNVETFRRLAQRMGFEDTCFNDSVDQMIDQALCRPTRGLRGSTARGWSGRGHVRLNFGDQPSAKADPFLPFANGNFLTTERQGRTLQRSSEGSRSRPGS